MSVECFTIMSPYFRVCVCRDATGKFPDYPNDEEGGSEAIFKKREEPVGFKAI